jgi:tagatose-1,6-bisphosphate aldolase non-catalytic subunit AgaZ/GatZ
VETFIFFDRKFSKRHFENLILILKDMTFSIRFSIVTINNIKNNIFDKETCEKANQYALEHMRKNPPNKVNIYSAEKQPERPELEKTLEI